MNLGNLRNKNVSEVPASLFCLELQHALSQAGPVALLSSPQAGLQIRIRIFLSCRIQVKLHFFWDAVVKLYVFFAQLSKLDSRQYNWRISSLHTTFVDFTKNPLPN